MRSHGTKGQGTNKGMYTNFRVVSRLPVCVYASRSTNSSLMFVMFPARSSLAFFSPLPSHDYHFFNFWLIPDRRRKQGRLAESKNNILTPAERLTEKWNHENACYMHDHESVMMIINIMRMTTMMMMMMVAQLTGDRERRERERELRVCQTWKGI